MSPIIQPDPLSCAPYVRWRWVAAGSGTQRSVDAGSAWVLAGRGSREESPTTRSPTARPSRCRGAPAGPDGAQALTSGTRRPSGCRGVAEGAVGPENGHLGPLGAPLLRPPPPRRVWITRWGSLRPGAPRARKLWSLPSQADMHSRRSGGVQALSHTSKTRGPFCRLPGRSYQGIFGFASTP